MNDQRSDDVPSETLKKGKKKGDRRLATEGLAEDDVSLGAGPVFQQGDAAVDAEVAAAIRGVKEYLREVRGFVLKSANRIEPAPTGWLWPGRIPLGNLTLLAGDSDAGKSLVTLDLAARVSTAAPWPDEQDLPGAVDRPLPPRKPGNVLIFTTHDNEAATLRPRLERAGADLRRVFFATGLPRSPDAGSAWKRQVRLPDDLESLGKALFELAPLRLIVLDPAWAFCGRGRGRSRLAGPAQLAELVETAAFFNVAIVGVTDLRRVRRGGGGYEAGGNRALTAAARAGWCIVRHPRDRDVRVLLPLKMNLGLPAPALEFRIDDQGVTWEARPAKITAQAAFAAEASGTEREIAEHWLRLMLSDGSRPARQILAQAAECGLSITTLRRAKADLGVTVQRIEFEKGRGHWCWSLGDEPNAAALEDQVLESFGGDDETARISAAG